MQRENNIEEKGDALTLKVFLTMEPIQKLKNISFGWVPGTRFEHGWLLQSLCR